MQFAIALLVVLAAACTAGSFVTGTVIIERRPPIEKVFYRLSQWLRNR